MAIQSWGSSRQWHNTFASGGQFELDVKNLVKQYTGNVWHSVRIETLLTAKGSTEMDIVFCLGGSIYILELKRVRRIKGSYRDGRWVMYGWRSTRDEEGQYNAQNVIEQNNIHARSLADAYYASYRCWPTIIPLVIVPDNCEYGDDLKTSVYTVGDLERFLRTCGGVTDKRTLLRITYLLGGKTPVRQRPDFVSLRSGLRGKK